jgi:hypothetical protein
LTEHLIDLLLRSAERLERLPEVDVHEILEQSIVYANCRGEQFIREHVQLDRFIFEEICVRTFGVMSWFVFASNTRILYPSMISLWSCCRLRCRLRVPL